MTDEQLKFNFTSKYKYIFKKDFGGRTGLCYKTPVVSKKFTSGEIKAYTDFGYELIKVEEI